jgi:hypothetical protein
MGTAQAGFSRVTTNKDSLAKIPAKGRSVTDNHVQNKRRGSRFFLKPLHAHQQAMSIAIARKPAAARAINS